MKPVVLFLVFALAAIPLLVAAEHAQDPQDNGTTVAFDHVKGNEWWVEVKVSGDQPFDAVGARDEGGAWVGLDKKDWGVWAGSFHIEPGHRVQFRAVDTVHAGEETTSCWFTHPEGVEDCSYAPGSGNAATFDHRGGNEWWVQVDVTGGPSRVQAKDTGGAWTELEHKDWGDWAASFHIEPGHDVRFRAMIDGGWQRSCWFTHPDGVSPDGDGTCTGPEDGSGSGDGDGGSGDGDGGSGDGGSGEGDNGSGDGGFDASFSTPGGNEWWVEVYVDGNEPLAGVDARDDGEKWIALEKKSWGAWAKSFHVEDGSLVDFRATSQDGDVDISGQYRWPSGDQVTSEPDDGAEPTTDIAFGPKAGNEWWVETIIVGDNEEILSAAARPVGGSWHELTYRDWGTWAASFHVPAGSDVEFRATTPSGRDVSDHFTWPDAHVGSDGSWPQEGSYVVKDEYHSSSAGPVRNEWRADEVYHEGEWWYHDTGTREDPGGTTPIERWGRFDQQPYQPTDVQPGDNRDNVTVQHASTYDLHIEGDPESIDTWYGTWEDPSCEDACDYANIEWDQATGLEVDRHNGICCRTGAGFEVLDTDAPLAIRD